MTEEILEEYLVNDSIKILVKIANIKKLKNVKKVDISMFLRPQIQKSNSP